MAAVTDTVLTSTDTLLNVTELFNTTHRHSYTGSTVTFYISMFLIWVPGTLTNILALIFIIRDMWKATFPAIILLCILCCCDLCAVFFSWTYHIMLRYFQISYSLCASLAFIFNSFNISSSVINSFMAIDRVLAICKPFFYKSHVQVQTWPRVCLIAGIVIGLYCTFPLIGLGDVTSSRHSVVYCESTGYREDPVKRVFGVMFGLTGAICILVIIISNTFLIRTLIRLSRRVTTLEPSSSVSSENNSTNARATPFEIAFAKLMLCISAAYLFCSAPLQIFILVEQFNLTISPAAQGSIHLLAGLVYTVDPMVYILIRKTNMKRACDLLCRCFRGDTTSA